MSITCPLDHDGCGTKNHSYDEKCQSCSLRLKTEDLKWSMNQEVYFHRIKTGILEKGFIVGFVVDSPYIWIRYSAREFQHRIYDEKHLVTELLTSLVDNVRDSRKRHIPVNIPVTTNIPVNIRRTSNENTTTIVAKPNTVNKKYFCESESDEEEPAAAMQKLTKALTKKKPKAKSISLSASLSSTESSDANFNSKSLNSIDINELLKRIKIEPVALTDINVYGPNSNRNQERVRVLDYCKTDNTIQLGVLHALYHWARPSMTEVERQELGDLAVKPPVTVAEMTCLLQYLPISVELLWNLPISNALMTSLPSTSTSSSYSSSSSSAIMTSSSSSSSPSRCYGDEITSIIREYLEQRFCLIWSDSAEAKRSALALPMMLSPPAVSDRHSKEAMANRLASLKLTLPMRYCHFTEVMDLAYRSLGGRDEFEERKGVKGQVAVVGYNFAMYGGVEENFVESCVIQRSRLGKDSRFVDIGSGIGQVCIQVAATVGCVATGLEVIEERHAAALLLLQAFDNVLERIGVSGRIGPLVNLKCKCFTLENSDINNASVIFFNNFGVWFTAPAPGKSVDYGHVFCEQIMYNDSGSQILTLNPLFLASVWVPHNEFVSEAYMCTWSDNPFAVYHYTIPKHKQWVCGNCTFLNDIIHHEICQACYTKQKTTRSTSKRSCAVRSTCR